MKNYTIEPTYKKSIFEVELWRRKEDVKEGDDDDDHRQTRWGDGPVLRREVWWRWAEWTVEVPETREEISSFLEGKGFLSLREYLDHHYADTLEDALLPCQDDDDLILPREVECQYCWDQQGEEFAVESGSARSGDLGEEERKKMGEEAHRAYWEENKYEEGLEDLGWVHCSTMWELSCAVTVKLQENDDEDRQNPNEEEPLSELDFLAISGAAAA